MTSKERDREGLERQERGGSKQKSPTNAASKSLFSCFCVLFFSNGFKWFPGKDLSHVPCKFYKVGGCTAGASCPFSHALVEPGAQKESCAWFVKGNCKFGHKCALAHILPGQSMAMDRKNKKAAQVAAAGPDRNERSDRPRDQKGGRGGGNTKREGHGPNSPGSATATPSNRNLLLAGGSTAPTRVPTSPNPSSRPPMTMPLKATLSPSAPAPPLASFGLPDDLDDAGIQLASAPAQGKQSSQDNTPSNSTPLTQGSAPKPKSTSSPGPLPTSAPRPTTISTKSQHDFGPIGSPPTSGSYKANGTTAFSPGTSPHPINGIDVVSGTPPNRNNLDFLSTSPFSAPGRQSMWPGAGSYTGGSGITASLGSGMAMMGGRKGWGGSGESGSVGTGGLGGGGGLMSQRHVPGSGYDIGLEYDEFTSDRGKTSGLGSARGPGRFGTDIAVEDEDLEDFLPSSLNDLLTPEERSRRMSRSNSGQGPGATLGTNGTGLGAGELGSGMGPGAGTGNSGTGTQLGLGHRYSRSVPAPTLLGDIKSIWADANAPPLPSPAHRGTPTSSSFASRFDPTQGAGYAGDESGLSMSIGSAGGMNSLSPSNASAAFLPGLHQHYLSSKSKQSQQQQLGVGIGLGRGVVRGTSGPLFTNTSGATDSANYLLNNNALSSTNSPHTPHLPPQQTYRATPSPFDLTQQHHHHHLQLQPSHTTRPIPSPALGGAGAGSSSGANPPSAKSDDPHLGTHLSPSTRALQAHAPGQSLPQGLAAGYSRIHALPPPPSLASPGSGSTFGSGTPPADGYTPSSGPYGGWKGAGSPPPTSGSGSGGGSGSTSGLDSMFSRLSYSAVATAARGPGSQGPNNGNGVGTGGGSHASGINNGNNVNISSPPGLQRNASGGRYQQHPLSPLSGPVVTPDDDDELFSMDG